MFGAESDSTCILPAQRAQNWTVVARGKHDRIEFSSALAPHCEASLPSAALEEISQLVIDAVSVRIQFLRLAE